MVHIALQQPFPHESFQRLKPLEKLTFRNLWTKDRQSTLQYMVMQRSYCASQQIVKFFCLDVCLIPDWFYYLL